MKRAGDARLPQNLGCEGFLILGHQGTDPHIARGLDLPVPGKGELVSCRVVPAEYGADRRVRLGGGDSPAPTKPQDRVPTVTSISS